MKENGPVVPVNIIKKEFTDVDSALFEAFGERAKTYREDFARVQEYDQNGFIPDFPLTLSIELVNRCNLKCIMCYTKNHSLPKATLTIEQTAKFFEQCKAGGVPALQIAGGAEPLLYKQIKDVLIQARNAGIIDIFLCTNGVLLDEEMSEFLVANSITRVLVSLDAATAATFRKVRGTDDYDRIAANIEKLIEIRNRKGATLPLVRVSFCVQEENVSERSAFLERWKGIVDYIDFQERQDSDHVDEVGEKGFEAEVMNDLPPPPNSYCYYPFSSLHVWSNGDVSPCCSWYAKNYIFGNLHKNSLNEIWNGGQILELRQQLLSGKLRANCYACLSQRDVKNFDAAKDALKTLEGIWRDD